MCTGLSKIGVDRPGGVAHVVRADLPRRVGKPVRELATMPSSAAGAGSRSSCRRPPRCAPSGAAGCRPCRHRRRRSPCPMRRARSSAPARSAGPRACRSPRPSGSRCRASTTSRPILQPWKQKPVCWQDVRPSRSAELIAMLPVWTFLVAELVGAGLQDLVVVVAGQARNAVGAGDAHLVLGLGVVGLQLRQRDRPVEQVAPSDIRRSRCRP